MGECNSPEDVQEFIQVAISQNRACIPQGGNTGLVRGSTPTEPTENILRYVNRELHVNPGQKVIEAGAAATIQDIQDHVAEYGLYFPVSYGSKGTATIGGAVATNAGGMERRIQHSCIGYEAVDGTGQLIRHQWEDPPTLLDSVWPDSRYHFLGSQGYFGCITRVVCQLEEQPLHQAAFWIPLESLEVFNRVSDRLKERFSSQLKVLELMFDEGLSDVRKLGTVSVPESYGAPYTALGVCEDKDSTEHILESLCSVLDTIDPTLQNHVSIADSEHDIQSFIHARETISDATRQWAVRNDQKVLSFDVSLQQNRAISDLKILQDLVAKDVLKVNGFGHFCQDPRRAAVHFNLLVEKDRSEAWLEDMETRVYDYIHSANGSHSAEHGGLGDKNMKHTIRLADPATCDEFVRLKRIYDPKGVFQAERFNRFIALLNTIRYNR